MVLKAIKNRKMALKTAKKRIQMTVRLKTKEIIKICWIIQEYLINRRETRPKIKILKGRSYTVE